MTHSLEPTFASTRRSDQDPWWWRLHGRDGTVLERDREEFATRSDAETWLGEAYPDLAEDGVGSVTLLEGEREVYGPMSLDPA